MTDYLVLDQPVRKDKAAREAPREPGVPPHVGRHSREAELAVLQRELAIAVEVGNSRVLAYLRSDQLRDAPENRLHSAARGQPRAGGASQCLPCGVRARAAREGVYTRILGTGCARNAHARVRGRCTRSAGTLPCRCRAHTSDYAVHTHAARAIMQVGALCSPLLLITLMGYAATSYADGLRATQIRAIMQIGYADDTSYDAGGRAGCLQLRRRHPADVQRACRARVAGPSAGRQSGGGREEARRGRSRAERARCGLRRLRGAVWVRSC